MGGFTDMGYVNDVYFLNTLLQRWEKPIITGMKPLPRESFSMNYVTQPAFFMSLDLIIPIRSGTLYGSLVVSRMVEY